MEHFKKWQRNTELVVPDSIPVLYFGDSEAYQNSPIKVVTVGLNPSDKEFPKRNSIKRFRHESLDLCGSYDDAFTQRYRQILDRYYLTCPYEWFDDAYGEVLEGFGASYYPGVPITALHTDIATPIPTNPTWSGIGNSKKDKYWQQHIKIKDDISAEGLDIFRALIEMLQPDILFVSVQRKHLNRLPNDRIVRVGEAETLFTIPEKKDGTPRTKSYEVLLQKYSLVAEQSQKMTVIYGEAAQLPFGTISNENKFEIGKRTREWYDAQSSDKR